MKQIGFKNFRKFEDFPIMDLGDITILVGGNNAGKSTLVKAILLIIDNLKNMDSWVFNLDLSDYHGTNSLTYKRALYNEAKRKEITFYMTLNNFSFEIVIANYKNVEITASGINSIKISDKKRKINITMCSSYSEIEFLKNEDNSYKQQIKEINKQIKGLNNELKNVLNPKEADDKNTEITKLKKIKQSLSTDKKTSRSKTIKLDGSYFYMGSENDGFLGQIESFAHFEAFPLLSEKNTKSYNEENENEQYIADRKEIFSELYKELKLELYENSIEYIYAHAASQKVIYTIDDKNDYLAKTLHEFFNERLIKGEKEYKFITDWMKEFEIGVDFRIQSIIGGAFIPSILKNNEKGSEEIFLSDMGMGATQIMILLFKLATFIRKYTYPSYNQNMFDAKIVPTIIIEEPELNLHPKLQSKLADLFNYINKKYKFKFIIETHSEYLVRRSQVLVAEQHYKDQKEVNENNPFKVYYFPENEMPYDMGFQPNGRFIEKFETGFFDASSTQALKLSKIERKNIDHE